MSNTTGGNCNLSFVKFVLGGPKIVQNTACIRYVGLRGHSASLQALLAVGYFTVER